VQRDVPTRDHGNRFGQHGLLQPQGNLTGLAEKFGVVDRDGSSTREFLGHRKILWAITTPGLGRHDRDRTERALARDQRNDHRAAQVEVACELQMLLIPGTGNEHVVGDLAIQLAHPGAHDVRRASR